MVSETKGSDVIDKPVPGRPHIILHTLPSLSFSTPTQSFNVQFSIRSPLDEKMATPHHAEDRPPSAPNSTHTFGTEMRLPPAQGRSSPQESLSSLGSAVDPETLSVHVKHLYNLVGGISTKQERMESTLEHLQKDVAEIKNDMMWMRKDIATLLRYMQEERAGNSGHGRRPSVSTPDLHEDSGRRRGLLGAATNISHRTLRRMRSVFGKIEREAHDAAQDLDNEENAMAGASGSLTQQQQVALINQPIVKNWAELAH